MGFGGPIARPGSRPQARVRHPAAAGGRLPGHQWTSRGRISGFAVADLRELGAYDWRFSSRNVWKVSDASWTTASVLVMSDRRYAMLLARYRRYKVLYPDKKPIYYDTRPLWM